MDTKYRVSFGVYVCMGCDLIPDVKVKFVNVCSQS